MKAFLDSTAGRTLIIAAIAAGTTAFAVPWDGAETVFRASGAACLLPEEELRYR
jgi:hypothetical protein